MNDCSADDFYFLDKRKKPWKRSAYIAHGLINEKAWDFKGLYGYSFIRFPVPESTAKTYNIPSLWLQYQTVLIHERLCRFPQYHIDGSENMWISKPCYNARGIGIQIVREMN